MIINCNNYVNFIVSCLGNNRFYKLYEYSFSFKWHECSKGKEEYIIQIIIRMLTHSSRITDFC